MAFGFTEPEHTVAQEVVQEVDGKRRRLQLRAETIDPAEAEYWRQFMENLPEKARAMTVPRDLPTYIAIEILDEDGSVKEDVLLFYKADGGAELVAEDWNRLVADPAAKSADLNGWYQKVVQGMGHLRGGGWVMY